MRPHLLHAPRRAAAVGVAALLLALPAAGRVGAQATSTAGNPACPGEEVYYNPSNGEDIVVPEGYRVEVFARDLNFPSGIAFLGGPDGFLVLALESGTGLPGRCNNNEAPVFGGKFNPDNPLTPGIVVFDGAGHRLFGQLGKPTADGRGFQPDGPAIDIAFERPTPELAGAARGLAASRSLAEARGLATRLPGAAEGGDGGFLNRVRLFASDSNQGVRGAPGAANNTSRIVTVGLQGGVRPFITGLPTGDHPTEQLAFRDGWIYWSQGSATNSGVTGHDNGAGGNQHDIPCQDLVLSQNTWESGDGHVTSGYSNHGVARPGATVPAFEGATRRGMCTGAILRARLDAADPAGTIEPVSWGYRNPFGIRFAPQDHPLLGGLLATENGEDERGARPTNNAPDRLQLAQQHPDRTPDYHGWPDRFGFLDSTQSVFDPQGGPGDDLCGPPLLPVFDRAACAELLRQHHDIPVRRVLSFFPQEPVAPLALEPADVAAVGHDFAPDSFVGGVVRRGATLAAREGDFGFSPENGRPAEGHDVQLVNYSRRDERFTLELSRFAFNCPQGAQVHVDGLQGAVRGGAGCTADVDQAFSSRLRGINRPVTAMFGPDGALYVVDYGAVRDFGQSDPDAKFRLAEDAPLVQIPRTGVIWKITKVQR
jgi:glucose/arabinose dehydrogenase